MILYSRPLFASLVVLAFALSVCAQIGDSQAIASSSSVRAARSAPDGSDGVPYTLSKGDNEFGFWAGGAFKATTAFAGSN